MEDSKSTVNKKYGIAFNEERKKIGLRQVDENMTLSMNVDIPLYYFKYTDEVAATSPPVGKTLRLDAQTQELAEESDHYSNRQERKQLHYTHWYKNDSTAIKLICNGENPDSTKVMEVKFIQADSILKRGRFNRRSGFPNNVTQKWAFLYKIFIRAAPPLIFYL